MRKNTVKTQEWFEKCCKQPFVTGLQNSNMVVQTQMILNALGA